MLKTHCSSLPQEKEKITRRVKRKVVTRVCLEDSYGIAIVGILQYKTEEACTIIVSLAIYYIATYDRLWHYAKMNKAEGRLARPLQTGIHDTVHHLSSLKDD